MLVGNAWEFFQMLDAHPLSPLLSIHHLKALEPIFPDMDRVEASGPTLGPTLQT